MKPINLDTQSSSDVRYLNLSNIPKSYEDVVNTVLEERQSLSVVEVDKVKGYVVNIENENQDVCDLTLTAHEVGKFATEFRTKRIWLGISIETFHSSFDSWVGEEVKFNIRDFETLDLTMEESIYLLPDLKEWLEQVEKAKEEGDVALAKFLGKDLKAKQRKCLNEKTKAKLMKLYEDTPNPTKKQMQELSKEIMIAEFSIEQWFHKKRRFDKRENRIKARLEAKKKNEERLNKEKNAYWDEKLKNLMSDYYKEKEFNKKLFERLKSEGKRTSKGRKRKLKQTTKETEKKNLMEDKVASATSEDVPPQRNLRERKNRKKYIEDESFNNDEVSVSEMQENIQQQQNDLFSHMSNSQTIEKEENDNKGPPKLNCSKTNVLLMVFSQTHHPDISMIQFLSAQLKLSTSSVEKWFEMMRLQNNIS